MKSYRYIFFVLSLLLLVVLTGCGPQRQQAKKSGDVLYTVTDATGTKLSFYEKPQRIVSLNVSVDEILLDVVDNKRIAALSAMVDDPSICSAGEKTKAVKQRVNTLNLEGILALQPDLVILPDYDLQPIRGMRSAGLKVYVCHTPTNIKDIYGFIKEIGAVTGETQAGDKLAGDLKAKLESVRNKVTAVVPEDKRLKVLCLSFTGPLAAKGTFADLCYYEGLRSVLEGIDIPYQSNLSEEKMLELNPDMIITPSWDYSKKGDPEKFRLKIINNPVYKNISAVKNNKVVRLHDNYLYSTSQYTVKAAEEMAKAAYPELFR